MSPVINFEIEFPEGFEDYAWEVEAKGWLPDVIVTIGDRRFRMTVYDPIRLAQEIESEIERDGVFIHRHLLVVPSVTPAFIRAGVASVIRAGRHVEIGED